jgi:hypothetical protein
MKLFKYPNHRNTAYLTWLRSQNCAASGQKAEVAHHMRLGTNGGSALKPSDYFCLPLTEEYHTQGSMAVHLIGEESFVEFYQLDLIELFNYYLTNYIEFKNGEKVKFENSLSLEERLNILVDKVESTNSTGTKPRVNQKKATTKQVKKVSITESEFYQRGKELRKVHDKKLRDELKKNQTKIKVKVPSSKVKISETDYYKNAKELNKAYAKKIRDENKEKQSEYRKKMYEKAKLYKKSLLKKK